MSQQKDDLQTDELTLDILDPQSAHHVRNTDQQTTYFILSLSPNFNHTGQETTPLYLNCYRSTNEDTTTLREPLSPAHPSGKRPSHSSTTAAQKATRSSSKAVPEEAPTIGASHICPSRTGGNRLSTNQMTVPHNYLSSPHACHFHITLKKRYNILKRWCNYYKKKFIN